MDPLAEPSSPAGEDAATVQDRRWRVEGVLRRLSAELKPEDSDAGVPPAAADADAAAGDGDG